MLGCLNLGEAIALELRYESTLKWFDGGRERDLEGALAPEKEASGEGRHL